MIAATPPAEPPPEPERPDCCGGGCAVCVLDGYYQELQLWREQMKAYRQANAQTSTPEPAP